ncbi:MAG: hypothetical protein Q7T59_01085 [Candidatus Woesebacteria bacterium]|nr:hypothetical protein [Candidatus Woesebacteria bacterium]
MKCPGLIAVLTILFAAASAFGQTADEPVPGVGFHCWIGTDGAPLLTRRIRCIADRVLRLEEMPDMQSPTIIDILHRELHYGSGVSTEKMFKANIERIRESREVWNIRIFTDPYDASWEERRPQNLVNAVLCPVDMSCTVMFTR